MTEPFEHLPPELRHDLVLVRTAVTKIDDKHTDATGKQEDLNYLLDTFKNLEVSIYSLPVHNVFDFALVGAIPEELVRSKIAKAERNNTPRFDAYMRGAAKRVVYRGKRLSILPADGKQDIKVRRENLKDAQGHVDKGWDQMLCGMLLFHDSGIDDPAESSDLAQKLEMLLGENGWQTSDYCLSEISWTPVSKPPKEIGIRVEFAPRPIGKCNSWFRMYRDISDVQAKALLESLSAIHDNFRWHINPAVTTFCFPALAKRVSLEVASPEQTCRDNFDAAFANDVSKMLWYGFDQDAQDRSPPAPDFKLPLSNFILSATSGLGKTNAALAVIDAFLKFDAPLAMSQGYRTFDVIYVNFKQSGAAAGRTDVGAGNEAKLLRAFLEKKSLKSACVRPTDIQRYLAQCERGEPAVIYTEPDGVCSWYELVESLVNDKTRSRGILFVFDEAFSKSANTPDVVAAYSSIYKQHRTRGFRAFLIGQELDNIYQACGENTSALKVTFLDAMISNSTVIFGSNGKAEGAAVRRVLLRTKEEQQAIVEWLGCGNLAGVRERAENAARPYKLGPVVVCPALYGGLAHAMPCHVVPANMTPEEIQAPEVSWWKKP